MYCVDWFSRIGVVLDGAEFLGAEGRCRLGSGRSGTEWLGTVVKAWRGLAGAEQHEMVRCGAERYSKVR